MDRVLGRGGMATVYLAEALVRDFGVAWAIEIAGGEVVSSSGLVVGTPAYMSPNRPLVANWIGALGYLRGSAACSMKC